MKKIDLKSSYMSGKEDIPSTSPLSNQYNTGYPNHKDRQTLFFCTLYFYKVYGRVIHSYLEIGCIMTGFNQIIDYIKTCYQYFINLILLNSLVYKSLKFYN